ncbi:hypothetical protein CQW23_09535 [Capsicum baccatum]|uniref:Uncharacterized protein n=1 Tax=Capsicum baccatum TaxID=33114 RepID=A0A2G2WX21_CAPBA|nr:hypothetical protein CQW23_09535 [Capsicum baccatum]
MSEIGKKVRASIKDGSLHTSVAQGQGNVRRKLVGKGTWEANNAEAFKATHTRNKKILKILEILMFGLSHELN